MSLFGMMFKGGVMMIPIFLCSLIALAVVIERWLFLRKVRINARSFMLQVKSLILRNMVSEAVLLCKRTTAPIAKITKAGVERIRRPREEIKEAIETAARVEIFQLEKNLGILATIAAVAPLLGFLGTVTGMIRAFIQVQNLGGNVDASVLAGGIWEALVTTAAGLIVGIPALIFYNWLQSKVEYFVFEMEENSTTLLDMLIQTGEGRDEISA
ncbi:MAG: MotA/TolQ/ExbB proton channel family protein [candidate division KSB1 bacterium]|nr:MotA/TolQ/ExbB proton channel family protein [candidate division KSB1 bacterium]MDZ7318087.1 MotA/TolQ/ExbB proton channel family protein [candidate division KSB1 bacterium]MDZ7341812.1 MotA/TolQ/ExbB proton channel family protein [candidate division KSB1 bacterium]